jgi:hypothetical protein
MAFDHEVKEASNLNRAVQLEHKGDMRLTGLLTLIALAGLGLYLFGR